MKSRMGIDGNLIKTFIDKENQEVFLDRDGIEKWITSIECLVCGKKIFGTYGKLSETMPICYFCRKTREPVKRGDYRNGD